MHKRPHTGIPLLLFWSFILILVSGSHIRCTDQRRASPKPHVYPRLDLPEKTYQEYTGQGCPYGFEYPGYATVEPKTSLFGEDVGHPCWFDLVFPELNGRIHCSYFPIDDNNRLDTLIFDSFALTGKHSMKAQYIRETRIDLPGKGGGMVFRITGPVASPTQFFVTDSTRHFLRGSLYFYNRVEVDSMRMIYDFIDEDIDRMLSTFYFE
jgi:gliding motility-associated lipoprotein GldD